ncbi:DNA/RNA-binding protein Alba-like protein [Cryptosporidium tyzzeri]|nr:DNA/RNA-binding protein Alba-like protein [Cryptosporidium tyzzeri]
MVDKLKINIYSANKQNIKEVSTKCVEFLKIGENRTVVLIAKSSAIPKAISISEIIKMEVPNVYQVNSLINLEVSLIFSEKQNLKKLGWK